MDKNIFQKFLPFFSVLLAAVLACDISVNITSTSEPPTAETTPILVDESATPTPEVFIALTQVVPARVTLNGITLAVQEAHLGTCEIPNCPAAPGGTRYLRVILQALNLPADQFIDYKNLPQGIAIHDNNGISTPFNRLASYSPAQQQLTLYFAVPEAASVFGFQWPGVAEIPLTVSESSTLTTETTVTYGVLTLTIPQDIANGASGIDILPVTDDDYAYWEKTPGHLLVSLKDYYILKGKFHQPQIYVYPALAYAQLVPGAFESMHRLRNVMHDDALVSVEQLPTVPFFNAAQIFASNFQEISFQNGDGVRFLTEYAQYFAPVNNYELIYHFQGFTDDGEYYIIAILPVTAPVLAETSDAGAIVPAGGIAFPDINDPNADYPGYYDAITDVLNATRPDAFTPTLEQLDTLIQSMRVNPQ